jgi:hypothetical protein
VPIEVRLQSPDRQYELGVSATAQRNPEAQSLDGLTERNARARTARPAAGDRAYLVRVLLDNNLMKEMAFVVELGASEPS